MENRYRIAGRPAARESGLRMEGPLGADGMRPCGVAGARVCRSGGSPGRDLRDGRKCRGGAEPASGEVGGDV